MSASARLASSTPSGNFQTSKKASPMFLLGAPPCSETSRWTMRAIVLTKPMTSSWSTSVASVNCLMSQNPKMPATRLPGTTGSSSPPDRMLPAMTSAPASPNPTASREQILLMAFSKILVSISFSRSGTPRDSSLARLVASGFSATARTFDSIRSMGRRTSLAASRCIRVIPSASAATMKAVRTRLSVAVICEFQRTSSTAMEAEHEALEAGGGERRPAREAVALLEDLVSSGSGRQPVGVASRTTAISEGRRPRARVVADWFFDGV